MPKPMTAKPETNEAKEFAQPAITSPIVLSEAPAAIVGRSLRRRTSLEEKNSPMQPAIRDRKERCQVVNRQSVHFL